MSFITRWVIRIITPLLIANQILGGGRKTNCIYEPGEKHGFTYGSYSMGDGRFMHLCQQRTGPGAKKADGVP